MKLDLHQPIRYLSVSTRQELEAQVQADMIVVDDEAAGHGRHSKPVFKQSK